MVITPFETHIAFRTTSNYLRVYIHTKRLIIRSYQDVDFENVISLYSDECIMKYFDHGQPRTKTELEHLIAEKGEKYFSRGQPFGLFSIFCKNSGAFIGQVDFMPFEEVGVAEIGFILHWKYHNQGFCSEVVRAMLFDYVKALHKKHFVCNELPIRKVIATVHPENNASRRVIENFGMTFDKAQKRFGHPRLWYSMCVKTSRIG